MTAFVLLSTQSFAQVSDTEKIICETLIEGANVACYEAIIEDCEANGFSADECVEDGDYNEAHQECSYEELDNLLATHNAANPKEQPLTCEM